MPDFEIKITTPVELEGAKQLADQLERNIGKAKALGQATDELEGKLKTVQSAIANAGEAAKEGAEKGFGEMIEGHHGIHAIGHALNQALPGLAQFTRFLTSGFTAAIGVALLAFEYLKSKIEEFNKLLDDLSTGPGARGEWAEKIAENTRSAAVETAVFNEKLRELEDRQESLAKSTDELIARQKKQAADSLAIADAQKELDLARLALAEKLGQVTPEQAVMIKLQIDDAAFKRQLEAEKAAIQAELSARQGELAGLQGQEPSLGRAMDRANATALAAANAQATNEAKLTQEQADLKAAQDSLAKSEALLLQPHHFGDRADTFMREEAEKNAEQQQRAIASLSQAIAQQKAQQTALEAAAAVAKQQAENAKADYDQAAKDAHDVLVTVNNLKADLAAATAKNATLEQYRGQTTALNMRGAFAADFQKNGPSDQESANFAGITTSWAASAAMQKIRDEATQEFNNTRFGLTNAADVQATINHIKALFASHADMTLANAKALEDLERSLEDTLSRLNCNAGMP